MTAWAIHITNDPGFEDELCGPCESEGLAEEVKEVFAGVPESAQVIQVSGKPIFTAIPE